ncbi:hypothetical protein KP509_31G022100 [Ceratopteris richardii]|uniref:Phospholipid/glycerol acyltransferase domain-containing protein n=1 Tax=Ceratopteris richardii TaxID=49495 RepID=A0A8T2QY16_CERRI|nr:hypothetical protein KP509_31G022100 [Ceratopteris richardii]
MADAGVGQATCDKKSYENKVVISPLEGTLLRDESFFPYYMLVALEAGGPLRALCLLLLSPVVWALRALALEDLAIKLQVFIAVAGLKASTVRSVAIGVLTKFFLDDLEPATYKAWRTSRSSRCVVTSHPSLFVGHFLRTHLNVDLILASELRITPDGVCTGFLDPSNCLVTNVQKMHAIKKLVLAEAGPQGVLCGICTEGRRYKYLSICKEIIVVKHTSSGQKVPKEEYFSPLVFHDGRLVIRPTPLASLAVALWLPFGFFLALMRVFVGRALPQELIFPMTSLLGVRLRVAGVPPMVDTSNSPQKGITFVCVHRTLADPTFLSMALRRKVRAFAFKVSKVSEYLTPIPMTSLTRNREEDTKLMRDFLAKEDIAVCPEGTTCREPFLLRFSPLFAELGDWLAPVAIDVNTSMFHATSARGYKFMDGIFLAMNPSPLYKVTFLEPICARELRENGKSPIDIANMVQKQLAASLGFDCTNYSRKDKYLLLAGHDGKF